MTEYERGFMDAINKATDLCEMMIGVYREGGGSALSEDARKLAIDHAIWFLNEFAALTILPPVLQ
jgi:hypothetical protein